MAGSVTGTAISPERPLPLMVVRTSSTTRRLSFLDDSFPCILLSGGQMPEFERPIPHDDLPYDTIDIKTCNLLQSADVPVKDTQITDQWLRAVIPGVWLIHSLA